MTGIARTAIAGALIALLVGACGDSAERAPRRSTPGLYAVDGVRLYLHCTGHGSPAVVLDAGLANDHRYWRDVQRAARSTRVCSWDRPGWGRSSRHPGRVLTATTVVRDLRALLRAGRVRGPFVVAGHSIGGLDMQLFARSHRAEIAGMVLIDSTAPEALARYDPRFPVNGVTLDMTAAARALRRPAPVERWPLVVVEHGVRDPVLDAGGWHGYQRRLARLSSDAILVRAVESGHDIAVDQPRVVARALSLVVTSARRHRRLPSCAAAFARAAVRCER